MLKTILVFLLLCTSNLIFSQDSPTAVDPIPISGLTNSEFDDVKLTVDESAGAQANPADNLADRESIADFINLFGAVDYGTDGAGSTTFGLSISTDGVGTGLFALDATASNGKGAEILLFDTAGFIEGRTNTSSGDLYFTISNTGSEIILNQSANFNIWHPENTNHNDIVSLNGISGGSTSVTYSINLVQIITDADGDSDSAVLNLTEANTSAGSTEYVFNFLDDGPTAVAPTSISDASGIEFEGAKLTVDESADSQNSDRLILRELVSTYTVVAVFTASDTYDDAPVNYAIDPNSINASYFAINQCGFVTLTGSGLAEIEANPALDSLIVNVIITYGEGGAQLPIHSEATIGIKSTHIVEQLEIDLNNLIEEVNLMVAAEVVTPFPGGNTTTNATITSGVYSQTAPATFGGTIIFDGEGDANSIFIFKTVGAIDTTAGTVFEFINGATANNILFVSDGAVTLGAGSDISGTFITTAGSITIGEGVNLEGRGLSIDGSINNYGNIYVPTYNVGDNADDKQSHADFNEFFSNVAVEGDGTTSSYGADGAGLALFSLKLNITNGNNADGSVGSGIYEGIENGSEILLFDDNGVIKGMVDNDVYFTVTNNGSKITLTETSFNIWYDDEIVSLKGLGGDSTVDIPITYDINLNQTIIDADGDSAISSLSLTDGGGIDNSEYVFSFKDDGPQFDLGYLSSLVLFSPVGAVSNISADNIIVGDVGHNNGVFLGFDAADHTGNIIDNDSLITDDGTTEACQANIPTISDTVDSDSIKAVTDDANTKGANIDSDTAKFAAVFENAVVDLDAGAPVPVMSSDNYVLAVTAPDIDSGLTHEGEAITLSLNVAGDVVGTTVTHGDVFTISVVNTGVGAGDVTLTQIQEIDHDTVTPGVGEGLVRTLADNLVSLTAEVTATGAVTDGDGDSATITESVAMDLGGNIAFNDDVPTISDTVDSDSIKAVTDDANTKGADSDLDIANFAAVFENAFEIGADDLEAGAPVPVMSSDNYVLGVTNSASGLTHEGEAITLSLNGAGDVVGTTVTHGDVFTISVVNTGVGAGDVTLTQIQEIDHDTVTPGVGEGLVRTLADNLVSLTAEVTATGAVTDGDGDSATITESVAMDLGGNIAFNDDGPTVVDPDSIAGVKLTVDETTLTTNASASFAGVFTETYGADGVGSVDGYALGVSIAGADSGLVDTATGNKVFLFLESGVVVGREGTDATAAATGAIVLNINVDAGLVTLDQVRAIVHSDTSNPDDSSSSMTANLITLAANVTDGDGDTANVVADIAGSFIFKDDGPTLVDPDSIADVKLTVDETTLTINDSASFAGVFTETYGADGVGSVDGYALGVSIAGADSGLVDTATGNKVFLFLESGVVVGREGTDATAAATGAIVLNINVDAGLVTLDQVRAIVHSDTSNPDDSSSSMTANLITLAANVTDGDGDTANVVADIAGSFIFIDDIPVAAADTGSVGEGALLTVLAAGGVLANDASGADGWAAPDAGVVGVVAGSDANIDTDSPTTLNTSIAGTYGTLILQDDGSYTYQSTANVISGNEADTFVYTVKDGDGDLTSETLTISLSDVTGETENTTPTEQANEAGIEGGSAEGDSSNIISGELSLQSGWSVNSAQSGSTSLGDWSVAPDGAFEYTLTTATTDVDVVAETDIFTYDAQDANGNTVSNTVTITIIDDSPEAYNDNICTDSSMGNVATGNVVDGSLTAGGLADNYGADVAGQLISFEHDGTVYSATNYGAFHTITTADGGTFIFYFEDVGVNVAGNFEYTASTGTGAEVTEVFTYTLRDADGDAASANVEICVDHETLAIEDLFLSNLNYYPNPVVYSFQIKGLTRTNVELELVNILGQQLKTIPNYNGEAVSIQEFSAGIYFINLKSETGFVSIKIIKTE